MEPADILNISLQVAQLIAIVASVTYLAKQVKGEKQAVGFQVYSNLTDAYLRHLWLATETPLLNEVWNRWEDDDPRLAILAQAQEDAAAAGDPWGAWNIMSVEEQICYRYTRASVELFEQAWELRRRALIGSDTWNKWENWMRIWKETRYFRFVFEDTRPRLLAPFCDTFEELC